MTAAELLSQQLTDIFRIGLLIALVATMVRTRGTTGTVLPLAMGILFVAVVIPMTMPMPSGEPMWRLIALGVIAKAICV